MLRAILMAYGGDIGYATNVSDAIASLTTPGSVQSLSTTGTTTTTPTPSTSASSPPTSGSSTASPTASPTTTSAATQLQNLNAALAALSAAYKTGDFTAIGTAQAKVAQLLQEYLTTVRVGLGHPVGIVVGHPDGVTDQVLSAARPSRLPPARAGAVSRRDWWL